jgi:nitrogenase-associated protein
MAVVTFYEKPGCKGNARQKALLAAAGHTVQAKSIKAEPWTREKLYVFLRGLPVPDWFNRNAPAVKAGEVRPESLSADEALGLLLANPLLVRRPLMEADGERRVGFDAAMVDAWIGLNGAAIPEGDLEACQHGPEGHGKCGGHEDGEGAGEGDHGACGGH